MLLKPLKRDPPKTPISHSSKLNPPLSRSLCIHTFDFIHLITVICQTSVRLHFSYSLSFFISKRLLQLFNTTIGQLNFDFHLFLLFIGLTWLIQSFPMDFPKKLIRPWSKGMECARMAARRRSKPKPLMNFIACRRSDPRPALPVARFRQLSL